MIETVHPRQQEKTVDRQRHRGADIIGWIVHHPVYAFALMTLVGFVLAAVLWKLSLYWPVRGPGIDNKDLWSNASTLVQAILGTALVGASAFVAIMIATSATRAADSALDIAKASLAESHTNNKINDPDYQSAKHALRGYQRYAFQMGSLLATYRLHKQQLELRRYAARRVGFEEGDRKVALDAVGTVAAGLPAWDESLRQVQQLLFDESFLAATFEAARLLDDQTPRASVAESHLWALRKNMAGLSSVIEQVLAAKPDATLSDAMMNLLARFALLAHELEAGIEGLRRHGAMVAKSHADGTMQSRYPLLQYLVDWLGQIPDFERERDFKTSLHMAFDDLRFVDALVANKDFAAAVSGLVGHTLDDSLPEEISERTQGLHRTLLVPTAIGDQATLLNAERAVADAARRRGLLPRPVSVTTADELPATGRKEGNNDFVVFTCTRKTLPLLFHGDVLGPYTRGCVVVDGMRRADMVLQDDGTSCEDELCDVEEHLQAGEQNGVRGRGMIDVVSTLSAWAFVHGKRADRELARLQPGAGDSPLGDGPRLAWIGIDYRELGVKAPTRLESYLMCELWSIFGRGGLAVGSDAAQMLGLDGKLEQTTDKARF